MHKNTKIALIIEGIVLFLYFAKINVAFIFTDPELMAGGFSSFSLLLITFILSIVVMFDNYTHQSKNVTKC